MRGGNQLLRVGPLLPLEARREGEGAAERSAPGFEGPRAVLELPFPDRRGLTSWHEHRSGWFGRTGNLAGAPAGRSAWGPAPRPGARASRSQEACHCVQAKTPAARETAAPRPHRAAAPAAAPAPPA